MGSVVQWINCSGVDGSVYPDPWPTTNLWIDLGRFSTDESVAISLGSANGVSPGTYVYENFYIPSEKGTLVVTP